MNKNAFSALSEKPFLNLWIGEIFTQIPTHLFNFFLILIIFNLTKSNTIVSFAVLTFTVPAIIFGSIAGVFVDRWNKKKVLVITNLIRAFCLIFLMFFLDNIFVIFAVSLVVSILVQFFIPAEIPMVPLSVSSKNLFSANALFGIAIFASILIAYVFSGSVILLVGQRMTLFILAIMLTIGAFFIWKIKLAKKEQDSKKFSSPDVFHDIKNTLKLMQSSNSVTNSLILLASSQILILVIATIAPAYATDILKIRAEEFPLLFAVPAAIGMGVGAVILVNFFQNKSREKAINIGIVLAGLSILLLPYCADIASFFSIKQGLFFIPSFLNVTIIQLVTVGFLAFFIGVSNSFVTVPANTMLQEKTENRVRGKIYGLLNMIVGILSLLPILISGGLSDIVGVGSVITAIALLIIAIGIAKFFQRT